MKLVSGKPEYERKVDQLFGERLCQHLNRLSKLGKEFGEMLPKDETKIW